MGTIESLSLSHLLTLAAVIETGSFRRAADERLMAPSTVHKHMRGVEHDLGLKLFERSGRGLRITREAEQLAEALGPILTSGRALSARVVELRRESRQVVRLACAPIHLAQFLGAVLRLLEQRHPEVRVEVRMLSAENLKDAASFDVILGRNDADFVATARELHGRVSTVMWQTTLIAVASDDHPLRRRASITVADLSNQLVLAQSPHLWSRHQLDLLNSEAGLALNVVTEHIPDIAIGTATSGLAIAVVADDTLPSLDRDFPRIVDSRGRQISTDVKLHWRKGSLSDSMTMLLDVVRERRQLMADGGHRTRFEPELPAKFARSSATTKLVAPCECPSPRS